MHNIKKYLENTNTFRIIKEPCKNGIGYIKFYIKNDEIIYINYDYEMYYFVPDNEELGLITKDGDLNLEYYNSDKSKKLVVEYIHDKCMIYITSYSNFDNEDLIVSRKLV